MANNDPPKPGGVTGQPPRPRPSADLYDPGVLEQVEREIAAEESGEERPDGFVEIPELPAPPPHNPTLWLLRQIKRVVVVLVLLWLAVSVYRWSTPLEVPDDLRDAGQASVPLPPADPDVEAKEAALRRELESGQGLLAAGRLDDGVSGLETLAEREPDTPAGRKAMLTLAATYRFQKNDADKALEWYRRFLDKNPNDRRAPATLLRLAGYLEELGRPDEARAAYQRILDDHADRAMEVGTAKSAIKRLDEK